MEILKRDFLFNVQLISDRDADLNIQEKEIQNLIENNNHLYVFKTVPVLFFVVGVFGSLDHHKHLKLTVSLDHHHHKHLKLT